MSITYEAEEALLSSNTRIAESDEGLITKSTESTKDAKVWVK